MNKLIPIAYVFAGIWISGILVKAFFVYMADPCD